MKKNVIVTIKDVTRDSERLVLTEKLQGVTSQSWEKPGNNLGEFHTLKLLGKMPTQEHNSTSLFLVKVIRHCLQPSFELGDFMTAASPQDDQFIEW